MRHKIIDLWMFLLLPIITACTSDNGATGMREVTLDIPVAIYSASNTMTSRAADQGDPGNDVTFKAPLYLYVYAFVSENNGNDYEVLTQTFTFTKDELSTAWTKRNENTKEEQWYKSVRVTFRLSRTFHNDIGKSRVFAIASRDDLSGVLPATTDVADYTSMSQIEAMTANLSSFTSDKLKDIYSTPTNDHSTPVASTDNGIIVGNDETLTCSTVKLYHVASKVDFTWEIPASLRKTVELEKIECTDLPTTCKIFEPTNNPTGTGTSLVIAPESLKSSSPANYINDGNKWLGRAYAFMLQPPSPGTINYTVTFGGKALRQNTNGSITPSSDAYSNIYTGWYRVIADVQ